MNVTDIRYSVLTDLQAVTPVHTVVMKAGGVLASTHHAGIFLLLGAKDQVTPWFLHTHSNKTLRLETQQPPIPTYQDAEHSTPIHNPHWIILIEHFLWHQGVHMIFQF